MAVPNPFSTAGVTEPGVLPTIEPRRMVVDPNSPGAGRDAGIVSRNDPTEISGRIQQIFSNLGAALGTESLSESERLADLTAQVQAGRSFDDLRKSAGIIAQNQMRQPLAPTPATPREYPTVAPPLSPEVRRALETRRVEADQALERAQANRDLFAAQTQQQAALQVTDIDRWQQTQDLATQRRLAARGVARSPMFANPAQREIFETANRAAGEVRLTLANTLAGLDRALREAESARQRELAEIGFDEAAARSDVGRLLGVQ